MSDEVWPEWVNKISVLMLYFSFPFLKGKLKYSIKTDTLKRCRVWKRKYIIHIVLQVKLNYFNAELHGFCGIILLSKPCLVVDKIWVFLTSVLPNVLPLNKRSNQQHYGLKLYKYETM